LREVDRRARLVETLKKGSGVRDKDLEELFDPGSDPITLRAAESHTTYRKGK